MINLVRMCPAIGSWMFCSKKHDQRHIQSQLHFGMGFASVASVLALGCVSVAGVYFAVRRGTIGTHRRAVDRETELERLARQRERTNDYLDHLEQQDAEAYRQFEEDYFRRHRRVFY